MGLILRAAGALPSWSWALVAALVWGGWQHHRAARVGTELLELQRTVAEQREQAMHAALIETTRRQQAQQEIADASADQARRARADADRARAALDGLRQRAARAAVARASDSAAAAVGAPAGPSGDLCADLLGRAGEAARQLASVADERGRAGAECVGRYDALTR